MIAVLSALVPGYRGDPLPDFFPSHVRWALWLSVIAVLPFSLWAFWRPFGRLSVDEQEAVLQRMSKHWLAPVRGLVQWWKLVAWMTKW